MRIPVTKDELGNGSFTSIAKYASRHWPGDAPLPLARAQNVVATCFGYDDLHDLQKLAPNQLPPAAPSEQQARDLAARVLAERYGLSTAKAGTFVQHWPLSKLRFSHAPAGGVDCPVTRHRQWRYLLRELAPLPEFRWLGAVTSERAMVALQPVAALARAIALWQPELMERDRLALDLIGADNIECTLGGRYYGLLPRFWNRPGMHIDLHLVGLEAKRIDSTVPLGLPQFEGTIIRRRFGDYRHSSAYRRPDMTVIANPGLSHDPDEWLTRDDGLLEEAARHPLLWLGYDWDDAEFDQMTMQAYGLQSVGLVDRNPFVVEGIGPAAGGTFSYGMASWRSAPGVREVPEAQRERILSQLVRVNDFTVVSGIDIDAHNAVTAQVRRLGELQQVEEADGRLDQLVVLGKGYYARPDNGVILDIAAEGAVPAGTGLRIEPAWLAVRPGPADSRWIDRACWVAQVWLDMLDQHVSRFLVPRFDDDADMGDWMGEGFDALFGGAGFDAATMQQLRSAMVPAKRKPIRPEHKPFVRALNEGDFGQACVMLKADPTLAAAENDEGQTALFYACREDALELAAAFADAGGNLEHTDRETWSALSDAARGNSPGVITLLAARGIDIEHGNAMGWTPLQIALTYNANEAAIALAVAGADLDRESVAGWTPRERATQLGLTAILAAAQRAR